MINNVYIKAGGGGGGGVTSVTGTAPVVSSGGATPAISMPVATSLVNGYLSAADWATFNSKVPAARTITINGTTQDLSANRTFTIEVINPANSLYLFYNY